MSVLLFVFRGAKISAFFYSAKIMCLLCRILMKTISKFLKHTPERGLSCFPYDKVLGLEVLHYVRL